MNTTELIEIAELCDAQIHETVDVKGKRGPHFVVFLPEDLQQFVQRIEQPLKEKVDQLQADLDCEREEVQSLESDIAWHEDQDLKHRERIAELEQELHYAKQAARVEADMYDQARAAMKQLREALQSVADKLGYEWLDKDFDNARQILEDK